MQELLYEKAKSFKLGSVEFSDDNVILIAGPCSVEDKNQMEQVAATMKKNGLHFLRGGVYKPRTNPYSFQGLGTAGIDLMCKACKSHGLMSVSEVMDTRTVGMMSACVDVLQIGARNMQNFELLKEIGLSGKPVLLKRGPSATIEELLLASEYMLKEGNSKIILCERGIRTFETETRNTLDVSAIPVIKSKTNLPVIADPSHAAGRKDLILPLSKAAIAAGANGLMVEFHPDPANAKSDQKQQLTIEEFEAFVNELKDFCKRLGKKLV